MRRKVEEHKGAGGATLIALVIVVAYSFWGASMLHADKSHVAAGQAQQTFAVK